MPQQSVGADQDHLAASLQCLTKLIQPAFDLVRVFEFAEWYVELVFGPPLRATFFDRL